MVNSVSGNTVTIPELDDGAALAQMGAWRFGDNDRAFVREAFVEAAKLRTELATADTDSAVLDAGYAMPDREHNPANPNCQCGHCPTTSEAEMTDAAIAAAINNPGVTQRVIAATVTPCWHDMLATAASGEQRDLDLARSARKSIAALILSEATEQVAGENETWDLLALAQAMQYIDQFISSETYSLIAEEIRASAAVETASDGDVATHVKMTCPACGKKIRLRLHSQRAVVRASEETLMPETAATNTRTTEVVIPSPTMNSTQAAWLLTQGPAVLAQMETALASFRQAVASVPLATADGDTLASPKPASVGGPLSDGQLPNPGATADDATVVAEGADPIAVVPPTASADAAAASEGEAEAGLTIVLHDSEDGSDPKLGTDGVDVDGVPGGAGVTDEAIPPHDHPADGSPPPGLATPHESLPEHDHPVDGSPPKPKAAAPGAPPPSGGADTSGADPNDPTKKKKVPPPAAAYKDEGEHEEQRRLYHQRNAAMVAEFSHEQLAQAVQETIADLPSMRRGHDFRTKAGRDAYLAELNARQEGQAQLIAMSNAGQIGAAFGITNPDYVKGRVAVADATVLMAEQDIDLRGLFSH